MKTHRIYAVLLRHLYLLRHSYDRMVDTFYWIALDLTIWGITGVYFQSFSPNSQNIIFTLISGVLLWNVIYRAQQDISTSLLEELWNNNLINLFVSPLSFKEWVTSLVGLGLVKSIISFLFGSLFALFLYHVMMWKYSYHLLTFMILLLMNGWWLGFLIAGFILRFGTKVQTISWTLVWLISPFSAVYYPLSILPGWVQTVAAFIPSSYIFEEARSILYSGQVHYDRLFISFGLNLFYLLLSILFLRSSFMKVLDRGMVKVY